MAKRHNDDAAEKGEATGEQRDNGQPTEDVEGRTSSRRSVLKGAAATAATLGTVGTLTGGAAAQSGYTPDPSGEVVVDPGEYTWESPSIGSGDAVVGGGEAGDVVLNLESNRMDGSVRGRLENVVVRGENGSSKAGLDLYPGCTLDGFVWPDGAYQDEDRIFYTPTGGSDPVTLRNSMWACAMNNGAYIDKAPVNIENCAAVNNNITGIRIGHRESPSGLTTHVRNTLVALTDTPPANEQGQRNARGLRLRHAGDFVIENCYFVYNDVDGAADLIELHDGAAGSTVTIRNCVFYNDSSGDLVRDKSNGDIDVTIEDCTVMGSGSRTVEPDYDGNGITEGDASVPTPAALTGRAAANEAPGFDPSAAPFDGSGGDQSQEEPQDDSPTEYEHTLVLHGSPDNPVSDTATPGDFDLDISVSGAATLGEHAESGNDTPDSIVEHSDGSSTIVVNNLGPDELDSFRFNGEVTGYALDDGYEYDVSLDGTTTTLDELVNGTQDGSSGDDTTDDGSSGDDSTGDGSSGDDSTDGTDDGSSGDDTTDDGSSDDGSSGDDSTGGSTGDYPHLLTVDGSGTGTQYTFTVSGDVRRDDASSQVAEDSMGWDEMEDIAREGKVIGVVGNGTDGYRFSGTITALTVDGDADVTITRNA